MEAISGSQRTLRSISLENNLSSQSGGVATPVRAVLKPVPPAGQLAPPVDTNHSSEAQRVPSYLGLSRVVSGYNNLTRYDSVHREGFRSRDNSPARLAFSRSRDSSPMRPEWKIYDPDSKSNPQLTAVKIRQLKEQLARCAEEIGAAQSFTQRGRQGSTRNRDAQKLAQCRSVSVDRGYLKKSQRDNTVLSDSDRCSSSKMAGSPSIRIGDISTMEALSNKVTQYQYSFERTITRADGVCERSESLHYTGDDSPSAKSFIQQRIERLYGPGALAVGFRSRRSLLEKERTQPVRPIHTDQFATSPLADTQDTPPASEGLPSVFRHLRPEFRHQLPVRRNKLQPGWSGQSLDSPNGEIRERIIPIEVESSGPERVPIPNKETIIPIVIEGRSAPKLPPKPLHLNNNNVHVTNGDVDKTEKLNDIKCTVNRQRNGTIENGGLQNGVVNGDTCNKIKSKVKVSPEPEVTTSSQEVKDGHYFLKIVAGEVSRIEKEVEQLENDLEQNKEQMSEEVKGKVLALIGKAKLLISQKIEQFRGLCQKNILGSSLDDFPTTCEDLAGFWDMVSIQVDHINSLLEEVQELKNNSWQEIKKERSEGTKKKVMQPKTPRAPKTGKAAEKSEASKARDEARKKMMEERRKMMEERRKAMKEAKKNEKDDAVEIFIPENK